jgi:hypothetical protein
MKNGFQLIHQQLASFSIAASAPFTVKLRDLATQMDGRIAHLAGFLIEVALTATYTTTPTQVGLQKLLSNIEFFDGRQVRFRGNGNDLRQFERLENGTVIGGDAKVAASMSTNPRYFSRFLSMGPAKFQGNPSDYVIPTCLLSNGELRLQCGALLDLSADTTAMSGTIIVTALLVPLDEIRLPPFYERQTYTLTSDDRLGGKGLYAFLGASKSTSYDAFAAGEVGSVLVETGTFPIVPTVNGSLLGRAFNASMFNGPIGGVQAEPINATHDTNQREPDYSGVTALLAGIANLQPYLWCEPGCRISKIAARVDNSMRIKTSGTVTTGLRMHVGRFLPQGPDVIDAMQAEAERQLNVRGKLKIKTLSKGEYQGPYAAYMPWSVKVAR